MNDQPANSPSCSCGGGCGPRLDRRDFVRLVGLGAAGLAAARLPVMAGPFTAADFDKLVPADKKLDPAWVAALFAPGAPEVYSGHDLDTIGMPIGGLGAGQLYLGGDGRLWYWDIFNQELRTGAEHYAKPLEARAPLQQGFAVRIVDGGQTLVRSVDRPGFAEVRFCGEYPVARVEYADPALPLGVRLEAWSPLVPLRAEDSNTPGTVLEFTLKNTGPRPIEVTLGGWLENAVCLHSKEAWNGRRANTVVRRPGLLAVASRAEAGVDSAAARPPIVFADFEGQSYGDWTVEGTAFGAAPAKGAPSAVQRLGGFQGKGLANSWAKSDQPTGRLLSPVFTIERAFISFLIGGGDHPRETCINLLVDDKIVRSSTGRNTDALLWANWNVHDLQGKTARIEIVDKHSGNWGHIDVDQIEFRDRPRGAAARLETEADFGTLALALLDAQEGDLAAAAADPADVFAALTADAGAPLTPGPSPTQGEGRMTADRPLAEGLCGAVGRTWKLSPGEEARVALAVTWHFPNLRLGPVKTSDGRRYAARFDSATAVAQWLATNLKTLAETTRLWHATWYDSTLPRWLLNRTMLNTSILATSTCHWFRDGRFYGWEGVGCCPGTCTHVWHYAHAVARLFPELERDLRQRTDFGLAFQPDTGVIRFRGEGAGLAVDGQAGCILRTYREHQMSPDDGFLRRLWPAVKAAMQCLIDKDNGQGLIDGAQHNTLDADWYGPVAWLSGLYVAALLACEAMARELGDMVFAERCGTIAARGRQSIATELFDGDYFINRPDPRHLDKINSGTGCHIDQVFGQSWAWQVGLPRALPAKETRQALASLWRYNFSPDVGPYREANKPGRWYAMAGEAGLLMCTFPRTDWNYFKAAGEGNATFAGYFNECMTGFEYQVAGHMLWEGLVLEGLAITRAIHDRYHPARRNPWNEVECGDHYARAMASYGVYLAACGFEYHGPRGHLAFAPRIRPEEFRAAFTAAEGWGTLAQTRTGKTQQNSVAVRWGQVKLRTLGFDVTSAAGGKALVTVDGQEIPAKTAVADARVTVTLLQNVLLRAGQQIVVQWTA